MNYGITVVDPSELPDGHDWLVVKTKDRVHAFLTPAAMTALGTLAKAWAGTRMALEVPCPLLRAG